MKSVSGCLSIPFPPHKLIQVTAQLVGMATSRSLKLGPGQNFSGPKEFLPGSLEGGQFLPNAISQQTMLNQGGAGMGGAGMGGASEMSRFGVPLMKVGKTEQETGGAVTPYTCSFSRLLPSFCAEYPNASIISCTPTGCRPEQSM